MQRKEHNKTTRDTSTLKEINSTRHTIRKKRVKKTDGFKTHKQQHIHTPTHANINRMEDEDKNENKPKQNHLSKCFDMKFIVIVINKQQQQQQYSHKPTANLIGTFE